MQTLAPGGQKRPVYKQGNPYTEMTGSSQIHAQASALSGTAFHASKP